MTTIYRSPNVIIDEHEWYASVHLYRGRIRRRFYFRLLSSKPQMWRSIEVWKGHKPKAWIFKKTFAPFEAHMRRAERHEQLVRGMAA